MCEAQRQLRVHLLQLTVLRLQLCVRLIQLAVSLQMRRLVLHQLLDDGLQMLLALPVGKFRLQEVLQLLPQHLLFLLLRRLHLRLLQVLVKTGTPKDTKRIREKLYSFEKNY